MHGQLILRTDCLRVQNALYVAITFSSKHLPIRITRKQSVICDADEYRKSYFGILDYLLAMQMGKYQVEMTIPFYSDILECHPVADCWRGAFAVVELVLV